MANRKQPNVSRVIQYCMWHNSLQYFQSWPITNCKFLPTSTKKILSLIIITFFIFFDPIKLLLDIIMLKCFIIDLSSTQPSIMHRDFFRTWLRKSLLCGRKYKIYNCKWFALPIAQMKENYQIFLLIDAINECSKLSFAKEFYLFF